MSTYTRRAWSDLMDETVALAMRESFTVPSLADYLDVPIPVARQVIHRLRHKLADDTVNIVCRPQSKGEPWRYELVGDLAGADRWRGGRVRSLKSQLVTLRDVATSIQRATPPTSDDAETVDYILYQMNHLLQGFTFLQGAGRRPAA
jgi:hypothetical protein